MKISKEVEEKVSSLYLSLKDGSLASSRENLTNKYRSNSGGGKSLIESRQESSLYAVTRMPATFVVLKTLFLNLTEQGFLKNISSVIDVGAGTGAGYFAVLECFGNISINLVEKDENMLFVLNHLLPNANITKCDITSCVLNQKADLVMSSYVLNELSEDGRLVALKNMLDMSNKYVLLVDAGTPKTYESMMKLKENVMSLGAKVVAPCMTETCTLKNDYCQFYARVERSSFLRQSKSATLPYEDEKYFYLLIEKISTNSEEKQNSRVIRRPTIKPNLVELTLCTKNGVTKKQVTKKDKEKFKIAKKIKINELI